MIHKPHFFWDRSLSFHEHERAFLKQNNLKNFSSAEARILWIKQLASNTEYSLIAKNLSDLVQKQKIFYEIIKNQPAASQEESVACLYYSSLLKRYYQYYGKIPEAAACQKNCVHLEQYYIRGHAPPISQKSWQQALSKDLYTLFSLPTRTTTIRQALNSLNLHRLSIAFAQLTNMEIIKIRPRKQMLGLTNPTKPGDQGLLGFKILGIGILSIKFCMNLGLMLKHVYWHTPGEMTRKERFWEEFKARHWQMGYDLQWSIISTLVNFPAFFHLTETFTQPLLALFLLCDMLWFLYAFILESSVYQSQKIHYSGAQRAMLDNDWEAKKNMYYFAFGGALCIAGGFSASLFFTGIPEMLALCYFFCVIGAAMYHACVTYGEYKKQHKIAPQSEATLIADGQWKLSMLKNTVMPMIMMAALMYALPLAVAILTLYAGAEYVATLPKNMDLKTRITNAF